MMHIYRLWLCSCLTLLLPEVGQSACNNELGCYQNIAAFNNNISQLLSTKPLALASAQQQVIGFWQRYFNDYLQWNNAYVATPFAMHKQLLLQQTQSTNNTKALNLGTLKVTYLLRDDVKAQASQKIETLPITPQRLTQTQGFTTTTITNQDNLLNLDTLLSADKIALNQAEAHLNRIDLATDVLNAEPVHKASYDKDSAEEKHRAWLQNWQRVASTSGALSSFYHALVSRLSIENLGKDFAISSHAAPDDHASFQQISTYLSHYQLRDSTWSNHYKNKPELNIAKARLYNYVSMHTALYRQYKSQERLLATYTLELLQNFNTLKEWRKINDLIAKQQSGSSSPSIPGIPALPTSSSSSGSTEPSSSRDGGSNACFIATHVYGAESWQVQALRRYRDHTLKQHTLGQYLVEGYYMVSPEITIWLEDKPQLADAIKQRLDDILEHID